MPTYEFIVPQRARLREVLPQRSASGEAELPCPVCGAIATRKISAGAGLVFKGSGFYITDYGKDGKKDQNRGAQSVVERRGRIVVVDVG